MNEEHLKGIFIKTQEWPLSVLPVMLKSAEDRPNSFSALHLYVPSTESVICGICKEKVFLLSLFRVRLGSVVRIL